jgi:hypothetical protein
MFFLDDIHGIYKLSHIPLSLLHDTVPAPYVTFLPGLDGSCFAVRSVMMKLPYEIMCQYSLYNASVQLDMIQVRNRRLALLSITASGTKLPVNNYKPGSYWIVSWCCS